MAEWFRSIDAKVWVAEWMKHIADNPETATDEGAMLGWFSNAIMAGYDTAINRTAKKLAEAMRADIPGELTGAVRDGQ
jgi:hypothetical protein